MKSSQIKWITFNTRTPLNGRNDANAPKTTPASSSQSVDSTQNAHNDGTTNTRSSSVSPNTANHYLTPAELHDLKSDEPLILDMYPLLQKHADIYTTAQMVRQSLEGVQLVENVSKGAASRMGQGLLKSCMEIDYEDVYHRMNTGQDGALHKWQHYAIHCLDLAAVQHLIHNKPLPIKLDNDLSIPAAKRIALDRARLTIIPDDLPLYANARGVKQQIAGGKKANRFKFPYPFSPDELGPDDEFVLDVSELLAPKKAFVNTDRQTLLGQFSFLLNQEDTLTEAAIPCYMAWFQQLRLECIEKDSEKIKQDQDTFAVDCAMLAVFARLLYGTPLRIRTFKEIMQAELQDARSKNSTQPPQSKSSSTLFNNKGGYVLHCQLKEGGPTYVVNVPFGAFENDPIVVLDMTEILGWDALLPTDTRFLILLMSKDEDLKTARGCKLLEDELRTQIQIVRDRSSPALLDLVRIGSAAAHKTLATLIATCTGIVCIQQQLYNRAIKLSCYPGMEKDIEYREEVPQFIQRAREECIKVLKRQGVPFEL